MVGGRSQRWTELISQAVLVAVTLVWVAAVGSSLLTHSTVDPQIHAVFLVVGGATLTARGALKRGNDET